MLFRSRPVATVVGVRAIEHHDAVIGGLDLPGIIDVAVAELDLGFAAVGVDCGATLVVDMRPVEGHRAVIGGVDLAAVFALAAEVGGVAPAAGAELES